MFLLRVKLIAPGEKRETSTKTCNETMLRDKLGVIVSRISPPLSAFLRLVFTSDGVVAGVVIRSVKRFDLVKIKPTESEAEH